MSDSQESKASDRVDRPGKTRTWWQQIQQFRRQGEDFAMQHTDTQYLGQLEEELQTAVLEAIPVEKRLQGLSPEEVLRRYTPEEILQRYTPEELAAGPSKEQAARLRELLKRNQGQ